MHSQADENQDGIEGLLGASGRNFVGMYCKQNQPDSINISSKGGKGSPGQDGGIGVDGSDGASGYAQLVQVIQRNQTNHNYGTTKGSDHERIFISMGIKDSGVQDVLKQGKYLEIEGGTARCCCCCIPEYYTTTYNITFPGESGKRGADGGLGGANGRNGCDGVIEVINSTTGEYKLLPTAKSKEVKQQNGAGGVGGKGGKFGKDFQAQYTEFDKAYKAGCCDFDALMNLLTCCPADKPGEWDEWYEKPTNRYADNGKKLAEKNKTSQSSQPVRQIDKSQAVHEYFEYMKALFKVNELSDWEELLLSEIVSVKNADLKQKHLIGKEGSKNKHLVGETACNKNTASQDDLIGLIELEDDSTVVPLFPTAGEVSIVDDNWGWGDCSIQ